MPRPLRSALFLPAANPRAVARARKCAADAIILDLEDAVAPAAKSEARAAAVAAVRGGGWSGRPLVVRVNGLDSAWGADDLAAFANATPDLRPDAILVPKVGSPDDLRAVAARMEAPVALWAMIESAGGVNRLSTIAASGGPLAALVLGFNDLSVSLGMDGVPRGRMPLIPVLSATVVAARANGLIALDAPCNEFRDPEPVAEESAQAAAFGFDGKALIHPDQIAACHAAFRPAPERLAWAEAVIAAYRDAPPSVGAVQVEGRMIERLHLAQAERILARAGDQPGARDQPGTRVTG